MYSLKKFIIWVLRLQLGLSLGAQQVLRAVLSCRILISFRIMYSIELFSSDRVFTHLAADHLCPLIFPLFFCRYKIYAEGFAWSVSLKYILSCGSLALIISPRYEDFFSRGLIPKKNYWPVSPTNLCPSIKYAVDWGNEHPSEVCFESSCYFTALIKTGMAISSVGVC